jgi:hypothetical protein
MGYASNPSIAHKRALFEGFSTSPAVGESIYYETTGQNWVAAAVTARPQPVQLQVQAPIHSGVLGSDKVFPLIATQGLRIQVNFDNIARSCAYQSGGFGVGVLGTTAADVDEIAVMSLSPLLVGENAKGNTDAVFTITVAQTGAGSVGGPYNNNPFDIGDQLYIGSDGTAESLGVVTMFFQVDVAGTPALQITYCPNRADQAGLVHAHPAGSPLYVLNSERVNGVPASVLNNVYSITYTITDLEYVLGVVSPPEGYVASMMKQIASSKGLVIDYKTFETYRSNLSAVNGLTNQIIPATQSRSYSVLSVPLAQDEQMAIAYDSLAGVVDGAQNYQYVLGNDLIPDRPIDLERYNAFGGIVGHPDALHLLEVEKALVNCGYGVRDLQRTPERFLIARAFSRYGQVCPLDGCTLSLRVEYRGRHATTNRYERASAACSSICSWRQTPTRSPAYRAYQGRRLGPVNGYFH